jgi:hypothetical protein
MVSRTSCEVNCSDLDALFGSSTDVGYIDKRIVAAAVGANGPASSRMDVRVFF